ncbi:Crp/Fnr family transcriptional regulator [Leptolyngbya sp. NIES-2104]|uniref:Crp/Fnr family transcriptional regulator n=1 Tax=Leptolyngbya sp. NIES-2104 TaxID=1552121 RepID=UPI0006ECBC95|nr:Crp/Fnr family transcriptional regulator [Leptolyngbya sp. NIES-2104]GAP94125.1 cAMP-binding protein - catabolite gene activator and regulatory subunit of cAMP-dependent protein kinase [Leptolyngbya sp. NIES-2104]
MSSSSDIPARNRLLAALPKSEYNQFLPYFEPVCLEMKQVLHEPQDSIEFIYFVNEGIVSQLTVLDDSAAVEIATIGNEGMVGLPVFLGVNKSNVRALVQIPGTALRMAAETFRAQVKPGRLLHSLLHRYTYALLTQSGQLVACNRHHSIRQRCCRWILMTQDRAESDQFPLVQEFMAQMLGVRRASVTDVFRLLQQEELIHHSQGKITVLNRAGLEAGACQCYKVVQAEFDALLKP